MQIDNLEVKIKADATSAVTSVNNLIGSLGRLSSSLSSLNTGNLGALSQGTRDLAQAVTALGSKSKTHQYEVLANGLQKIASVNSAQLTSTASSISTLSTSLVQLSNAQTNVKGMNSTINALSRLAYASGELAVVNQQLPTLANTLTGLANSLSGTSKISDQTVKLVTSITSLAKSGGSIPKVASELPLVGQAVTRLVNSLALAPIVPKATTDIVRAIAQLANASSKADATDSKFDKLADGVYRFVTRMQNLPQISAQAERLIVAMGQLASAGKLSGGTFNGITNGSNKTTSALRKLKTALDHVGNAMHKAKGKSRSLASTIGMLYAKFFLLRRVAGLLKKSIDSAMDYVEDLNYFNAAFGQVADKAKDDWAQAGYDSATAYYNSFAERAEKLTSKMSGYAVTDSGQLQSTGIKNLGMNPSELMQYQAQFAQMSSSMGVSSEYALKLSNALTELGGDLASVRNMNFNEVWQDMASGMVGMSRTVDKYGANIRNSALQLKMQELGIKGNIQALSQQDKALLRAIVLIDSSRYAWGDLAKTINQPANQMRMLTANLSNLGRTIGNIFLPIVAKALPYINAFVNALQRLAQWIVKLLGFDDFDWGGLGSKGGGSDVMSDILDDVEGTSDALASATNNAKKLNKAIRAFDELNVINTSEQDSKAGSGASGVGNATGLIQDAFDKMLEEYQSAWDKAFDEMSQKQQGLANNLVASIKKAWTNSNGEDIGKVIASWFNKGIEWVNNNSSMFEKNLNKISKIIATTINGFTYDFDWSGLGTAIGNSLNSYLKASTTFFSTTDFGAIGKGIATSLNNFVDSGAIQKYLGNWGAKIRAAIEFAFGAITTFNFPNLGKAVGQGLNDFFKSLNEVKPGEKLNGWQKIGITISKSITGIAESLITALNTVNWVSVGQGIADMIASIDWGRLVWDFVSLFAAISSAIVKAAYGFFKEHPIQGLAIVVGGFGLHWAKSALSTLFAQIAAKVGVEAAAGGGIPVTIPVKATLSVAAVVAAAWGGEKAGKWLYEKLTGEKAEGGVKELISGEYTWDEVKEADKNLSKDTGDAWANWLNNRIDDISNADKKLKKVIKKTFGKKKEVKYSLELEPDTDIKVPTRKEIEDSIKNQKKYKDALNVIDTVWKDKQIKLTADPQVDTYRLSAIYRDTVANVWADKDAKLTATNKTSKSEVKYTHADVFAPWSDKTAYLKASSEKLKAADVKSDWHNKVNLQWSDKTSKLNANSNGLTKESVKTSYTNKVGSVWVDKIATLGVKVDNTIIDKAKQTFESLKKTWKDMNAEAKVKFTITSEDDIKKFINENLVKNLNRTYGYHIPQFATGGIVPKGELFVANEAGPEYVGSFGGKTGVANTQQIVEGISLGVSEANAETNALLRETNRLLTEIYGKDMGISQDDIFSSVRTSNQRYKLANGVSAFA